MESCDSILSYLTNQVISDSLSFFCLSAESKRCTADQGFI